MVDAVDKFAEEASRFEQWALQGTSCGKTAAQEALIRITRLYSSALDLPPPWNEELANQPDTERVGVEEWRTVFTACIRFPLQAYGEVFNPLPVPPEDPVVGNLSDDIAHIFRDVVTGLRAYQSGQRKQAIWEWGFGLQHHWGEHATSAIRALHCWLAANALDCLP